MQEIGTFLVDNWQPLVSMFCSLVALIIALIKKRPSARSVLQYIEDVISNDLPSFILVAEKTGFTGDKKLSLVLDNCLEKLSQYVLLDDEAEEKATRVFTFAIENILSTPRKKGD